MSKRDIYYLYVITAHYIREENLAQGQRRSYIKEIHHGDLKVFYLWGVKFEVEMYHFPLPLTTRKQSSCAQCNAFWIHRQSFLRVMPRRWWHHLHAFASHTASPSLNIKVSSVCIYELIDYLYLDTLAQLLMPWVIDLSEYYKSIAIGIMLLLLCFIVSATYLLQPIYKRVCTFIIHGKMSIDGLWSVRGGLHCKPLRHISTQDAILNITDY